MRGLSMLAISRRAPRSRGGFTLVEMLVAMTCTILLMFAITQTFQNIGEISARGRAAIELTTQLRGVQHRLRKDLEGLTVTVRPWPLAGAGEGYLEIYEGPLHDAVYAGTPGQDVVGDFDDILAMTIRSSGEPFVGRFNGALIQSQIAEVIWFTSFVDRDGDGQYTPGEPINIHRRVLLVRPDLNNVSTNELTGFAAGTLAAFLQENDLSVSVRPNHNNLVANSLSDLTQRENRFAHVGNFPTTYPINFILANSGGVALLPNAYLLSGVRTGEDVMLSNVLAFDLRVYDRTAITRFDADGNEVLSPGDPGYNNPPIVPAGLGTYVDLRYSRYSPNAVPSEFSGGPVGRSRLATATSDIWSSFDTWSFFYEHVGSNDGRAYPWSTAEHGRATNGIDDDGINGVDDVGERLTAPPYPVPLRGMQVRIRVLEPQTRQVRQATVVQDFIPE
jgi:type II secretory pathway pseudopilin PulG